MKAKFKTRRDMCYSVGRRASTLDPNQAAKAWEDLALRIEDMGAMDIPKFRDLIKAVRDCTILAKSKASAPVAPAAD